jgi:hypothetical protein
MDRGGVPHRWLVLCRTATLRCDSSTTARSTDERSADSTLPLLAGWPASRHVASATSHWRYNILTYLKYAIPRDCCTIYAQDNNIRLWVQILPQPTITELNRLLVEKEITG